MTAAGTAGTFGNWVAGIFPHGIFSIGKRDVNEAYPDKPLRMDVELTVGERRFPFTVVCKWRGRFMGGQVDLAAPHEIAAYQEYAAGVGRPVVIGLGVGGSPAAPADVYIVPLSAAGSGELSATRLLRDHKQPMQGPAFYFDPVRKTLKY